MTNLDFLAIHLPTHQHFKPDSIDFQNNIVFKEEGPLGKSNYIFSFDGSTGDVVLLPSVGTFDKNDKIMYNGDIIKITPHDRSTYPVSIFVIEKQISPWGEEFKWVSVSGYACSTHILQFDHDNCKHLNAEVIGNIYDRF